MQIEVGQAGMYRIVATLLLVLPATVHGGLAEGEQAAAWQRFLDEAAQTEPSLIYPYEPCFRRAAAAHALPLSLLLALARGESDFDPSARSHANAHGLMQILWPDTAHHLGIQRLSQLYDPCTNVEAGARYLAELLAHYDGDLHRALAAYNYGPKRISRGDGAMPAGAEWYSAYIYRHLGYVLGAHNPPSQPGARAYAEEGKIELAAFAAPYRAAAFVQTLLAAAPSLRLDWFRVDVARFRVVLIYDGSEELERSRALLVRAGFPLP
jgi:hypothetical protein